MSPNTIQRVRYFDQQILRTEDFVDEQAYHVEMRRRHNIAHHTWGIACGLELAVDQQGLVVRPGMAIDGYGRELILPQELRLSADKFAILDTDKLDVFLIYDQIEGDRPPKGYQICDQDLNEQYYRLQEIPRMWIRAYEPGLDPRRPPKVTPEDLDFASFERPPDDPGLQWPVFLGRFIEEKTDDGKPPKYHVDFSDRPYIGLVGTKIQSPDGSISLGLDSSEGDTDKEPTTLCLRNEIAKRSLFAIDHQGEIDVFGRLNLHGGLDLKGGGIELASMPLIEDQGENNEDTPKTTSEPWLIYRHTGEKEQLRLDIGPENGELVIGSWSEKEKKFNALMTFSAEGKVTVHGDLIVKGSIKYSKGSASNTSRSPSGSIPLGGMSRENPNDTSIDLAQMSPEARRLLMSTYASGVYGSNIQLQRYLSGENIDLWTPEIMTNMVNELEENPNKLEEYCEIFSNNRITRLAMIQRLIAMDGNALDEIGQEMVTQKVEEAKIDRLISPIIDDDEIRRRLMSNLLKRLAAIDEIVDMLAENDVLREDIVKRITANVEARKAVMKKLLEQTANQMEAVDVMNDDHDILDSVIRKLIIHNHARSKMVEILLNDNSFQQDAGIHLAGNAGALDVIVEQVINNEVNVLEGMIDKLLNKGKSRKKVGTRMMEFMIDKERAIRNDVINPIIENGESRPIMIADIMEHQSVRESIGENWIDNESDTGDWTEDIVTPIVDAMPDPTVGNHALKAIVEKTLSVDAGLVYAGNDLAIKEDNENERLEKILAPTFDMNDSIGFVKLVEILNQDEAYVDMWRKNMAALFKIPGDKYRKLRLELKEKVCW